MLLVHPIKELLRFLPVLLGLLIAGSRSGGNEWWWNVLGIGVPIALGVARYLTTSFRITEGRVELRRGLLNKHVLSTPIDRVRTVDITRLADPPGARPDHRAGRHRHGLQAGRGRARPRRRPRARRRGAAQRPAAPHQRRPRHARARRLRTTPGWSPGSSRRWLWYAPFTTSGMVIAAAVLGAGSQVLDGLGLWDHLELDAAAERVARLSVLCWCRWSWSALLVVASVLAVAGLPRHQLRLHASPTPAPTTSGTCAAGCSRRARRAWTPTGCAASTSSSRSDCGWPAAHGCPRSSPASTASNRAPRPWSRPRRRRSPGAWLPRCSARRSRSSRRWSGHGPAAVRRRYTRALAWPLVLSAALVVGVLVDRCPAGLDRARTGRRTRLGRARPRPGPWARPRAAARTPRRPVRQPDAPPSHPRDPRRHRLDLHLDLVPAPRRPDHRPGHHGRRSPVGHGPRRARGDGYGAGARRRPGAGRAVPRDRWSRRAVRPVTRPSESHGVS